MRYFFDVTHDAQYVAESNRWEHSLQDDEATPLLKIAFLAPLLANAGRMAATAGAKQMGKVGVKQAVKEGGKKLATKQGMKELATGAAKKVNMKELAQDAMSQQQEASRHKQMMQQQEQNRLMEAGKAKASTGSSMSQ